jgi:hypothetical protein
MRWMCSSDRAASFLDKRTVPDSWLFGSPGPVLHFCRYFGVRHRFHGDTDHLWGLYHVGHTPRLLSLTLLACTLTVPILHLQEQGVHVQDWICHVRHLLHRLIPHVLQVLLLGALNSFVVTSPLRSRVL